MRKIMKMSRQAAAGLLAAALVLSSVQWPAGSVWASEGQGELQVTEEENALLIPQGGVRPGINIASAAEPSTSFVSGWDLWRRSMTARTPADPREKARRVLLTVPGEMLRILRQ